MTTRTDMHTTFGDWVSWAYGTLDTATERPGQHLMNALGTVRPDLYEDLVGTGLDPYYREELVPAFLSHLGIVWTWV